jgi:hypothetical protein
MKYEEVEKYVQCPIYLESTCTNGWLVYKAYGIIESLSPYVAIFVPTQVMSYLSSYYKDISPIRIPTVSIDKICAIVTPGTMYDNLLL